MGTSRKSSIYHHMVYNVTDLGALYMLHICVDPVTE